MANFNYNGQRGRNGYRGSDGHSGGCGQNGGNGSSGGNGYEGQNASNLALQLSAEGNQIIMMELNKDNQYSTLPLGDCSNIVNLSAEGGIGGDGGQGGNGGSGGNGRDGSDATQYSSGTDGGDGGNGGNGGTGGIGGNGGNGGVISVNASQQDMDLLMIINSVNYSGGSGGSGGQGGCGGPGGRGGRGGSSYSWTTTDSDNTTQYHSNSGGSSGRSGSSGYPGSRGMNGGKGQDGDYFIQVGGQRYRSRYNMKIDFVEQVVSDDNIIEPGESLQIRTMSLSNNGGMPTPIYQRIGLSLVGNIHINFNEQDKVFISKSLEIGQIYRLESPLKFQIFDFTQPIVDRVYKVNTNLNYRAIVERVNKGFDQVAEVSTSYHIRFPVEMSEIQVLRSIQPKEEAPIAFSIWNRSSKPIGIETISKRLLNVRIILNNKSHAVQFFPKRVFDDDKLRRNQSEKANLCYSSQNFINPQTEDENSVLLDQEFITQLNPNEKKIISGTLKFIDLDIPYNTSMKLQAKLDLGFFHNQSGVYQNIQTRNFALQFTQAYEYKPNSEFLLIINSETKRNLIEQIKQFAYTFGSHVDIWNISNYQGFSYDHISNQDKSFRELYKDKVVIILCNNYILMNGVTTNAVKQIEEKNIYKASKFYNIRQYIIGQNELYNKKWVTNQNISSINSFARPVENEKKLYKRFTRDFKISKLMGQKIEDENALLIKQQEQQGYSMNFVDTLYCCSTPTENRIQDKCENILTKIDRKNCSFNHQVIHFYSGQIIKSSCFSKYCNLGNIKIIENLRKDQAEIIQRSCYVELKEGIDSIDEFCLVKLLSFEKKIQILERSLTNVDTAKLVISCIFSDLADEYITYIYAGIKRKEYSSYLKKWAFMLAASFQNYFQVNQNHIQIHIPEEPLNKQSVDQNNIKKIRDHFYSLIYQFKIILSNQQNCFVKLFCCGGKVAKMVNYCSYVLESVTKRIFKNKLDISKQNQEIKKINALIKPKNVYQIQQPYLGSKFLDNSGFYVSNIHTQSLACSHKNFGDYQNDPYQELNRIQEGSFYFIDDFNQQIDQFKRITKVEQFEQRIFYEKD